MAEGRVGTSGWSYGHWRGDFYPDDLTKGKELEHYTTVFDTVELNSSFDFSLLGYDRNSQRH